MTGALKKTAYAISSLSLLSVFSLGIYSMGGDISLEGILILLVTMIPMLYGIWTLTRVKQISAVRILSYALIALGIASLASLYDALFAHPDAQGGMVFFVIPVYQFPVLLIASASAFYINRKR